ncbi:hypothetical protein Tco_0706037 [Tanacetum coccineum]|uniref:Uncharacterized protein n=1 Tax=Tanacetum coccineum TaxID=301880 RepID=A0ABQ4Y6D1_9ASTR
MFVEFVIQNQLFSYSLENFAQILDVSYEGACVFTDRWRLDELAYGIPSDVRCIRHEEEIDVHDYQILTPEIIPTLKPLEEIIWENVFCLGVIEIMFPRVFVLCFTVSYTPKESILPITWQNEWSGSLSKLEQKPRRDRGTRRGRHSTSSSSAFDQPSLSHLNDDDDDGNDEGTSREILGIFLSKTPSTNQTSSIQDNTSSSFQSKLQISPPSSNESTSPQPLNPLLENILDVPPRPLNPQPLQSIPSLDITLSLSPITPLENLSSLPSPSPPPPQPPIMGHPLYYNYHDYHGSTCICCFHNRNLLLNF